MRIVMVTNTYKPIVGGLEKSVEHCSKYFRKHGHDVIIVTPEFEDMQPEDGVVRVPAIQHFNGTDFSVDLPIHARLTKVMKEFEPQIVHSHHPFLLGDTALRMGANFEVPVVFTHHTLYEEYVHYVPFVKKTTKAFVKELGTGYANLCDQVIAPSESVAKILEHRGVETPIEVIPTGIDVEAFARGDGHRFREAWHIPQDAFVVGYISRVAKEKNMDFYVRVIASFLKTHPKAWAFIGGGGPALDDVKAFFKTKPGGDRVVCPGTLKGEDLLNAYHAMNVFAFASHSETQGLVLAEAMAAGKPVVAVDAPGVRDILQDGYNGYMLDRDLVRSFVKVLGDMAVKPEKEYAVLSQNARKTVQDYDIRKTSDMILALYGAVIAREYVNREEADSLWQRTKEKLRTEFEILKNMGGAAGKAIGHMMQAS